MPSFEFPTESLELASFLDVSGFAHKKEVPVGSRRVVHIFNDDDQLRKAIIAFERGASLPAKRLLTTRARLFREASEAVKAAWDGR